MDTLAQITDAIMADPANQAFTARGDRPLFSISPDAELLLISQAPSRLAQSSMTFWNDPSGDRLRTWLGVSRETFYNSGKLAVLPLDFYFPGKGKSGDLPPRKGFAEKWHAPLLALMPKVRLSLLIGAYAQNYYLGARRQRTLTETVRHYQDYLPQYFPLVHPSPLNYRWMRTNPWFESDVVPALQTQVAAILD
ncbi:uracil-DNA glycosylase family protein [Lacticaseibacillus mingshuiensis]|uniref:Uracil-DNA glycosylase family protein n=1 Tax=Lacticaseibacillus mingshuiensis TaxID=2799574 RepID=A0ABW4CFP7_9LACO|nr:uracil-DNA glycosylase family protein [Lacticaseibacillus mingshuiensis]